MLTFGSLVGAVAGGYIVAGMGLAWLHWMNVVLSAISFVLCLFFQAETLYDRKQTTVTFSDDPDKQTVETKERVVVADAAAPSTYPSYSYLQSVRLWSYRPGLVRNFLGPYKVLRLPGVWLVSGWYAGLVGLIVTMSSVGPQLVAAPPYLWGKNVGLINIGGIFGALFGCVSLLSPTIDDPPLTNVSRSTPTSSPTSQPSASQRKTSTASPNRNLVSLLLFPRWHSPPSALSSSASWRRIPRLPGG
jgi:MFS family permease